MKRKKLRFPVHRIRAARCYNRLHGWAWLREEISENLFVLQLNLQYIVYGVLRLPFVKPLKPSGKRDNPEDYFEEEF